MRFRVLAVGLFLAACACAQSISLDQLRSFVESSVRQKLPDKDIANYLKRVKLTQKLDDRTIENWLALGIGPKTRAALDALRDESKDLVTAKFVPPPPPEPPPDSEEQGKIIDEAREYAINYTKSLPNFLCTQVTRRKAAPASQVDNSGEPPWQSMDTLTLRLSYFEQKEDYKLIMVNNQMTTQDYQTLGGATSTGEFGSMLREIFSPATEARFEWDHWGTLRGRRMMVFRYYVAQAHSQWGLDYEHKQHVYPAYHGLVYIDNELHLIKRLTLEAENIPVGFPIRAAETILDYDFADISGHDFLLPLKSQSNMSADGILTRNDIEFRLYRKYSAEAEIKYDITPDPLPADQTVDCKDPKNAGNPACKK
ncbi:MAG: hypothetical protein KGN36_17160 [Acidobacteriota bacterium]|nr:hypothetical protein [Acidobacteriota bacterium]